MQLKVILTLGSLVAMAVVFFFIKHFQAKENQPASTSTDEYFLSTQSESNDRVVASGLDKITEDVSYLLDDSKLNYPRERA